MADTNRSLTANARRTAPKTSAHEMRCAQCDAQFTCGRSDPAGCWCAQIAPLPAATLEPHSNCLCRTCLIARGIGAGVSR